MSVFLLALAACADKAADSGSSAPPINQGGGGDSGCGGTAPVIDELTIVNGGIVKFDSGPKPTVGVQAHVTDEDADLDVVSMDVWYDDVVDNQVDTTGTSFDGSPYEVSDEPCTSASTTFTLQIQAGSNLEFDSLYEFAAVVTDGNGEVSEVAIASGYTPTSEGEDGGAR